MSEVNETALERSKKPSKRSDGKHVQLREPETGLLSVDGISNWALADQQYHKPAARSLRQASRRAEERRLARPDRTRTRRRPRKRRARAVGGLLPRLDGDDAAAGDGLWAALRIRHLPAICPRRLAARTAGQLAASAGSVGGRSSQRDGRGQAQLLLRAAWRELAPRSRPALRADRHPV